MKKGLKRYVNIIVFQMIEKGRRQAEKDRRRGSEPPGKKIEGVS